MTIEITARHFSPSDKLNELVQKKISKMEKYSDHITSCHVILFKEGNDENVEIKAHVKGKDFFAQESAEVFEKALTTAVDRVVKQIKKHHDKLVA